MKKGEKERRKVQSVKRQGKRIKKKKVTKTESELDDRKRGKISANWNEE